jgi:hypothetical protein
MDYAEKLREYIPQGDGHNSEYANDLAGAADELDRLLYALKKICHGAYCSPERLRELAKNALMPNVQIEGQPASGLSLSNAGLGVDEIPFFTRDEVREFERVQQEDRHPTQGLDTSAEVFPDSQRGTNAQLPEMPQSERRDKK